jgi:hypothetical protein
MEGDLDYRPLCPYQFPYQLAFSLPNMNTLAI